MARFSAILAALCVSLGCSTSADDPLLQPLRIGTGSSNGGFYQVGNALAQLFNERVAGVSASAVTTGQSAGSVFNIHALEQRSVDLAFARVDLAYQAYTHGTPLSARPHRRLRSIAVMTVIAIAGLDQRGIGRTVAAQASQSSAREVPTFQVDPSWPKLPEKWALGLVSDVFVDAQDHVWIQHRFRTAKPAQNQTAAPPVLEFDAAGNFIQGWGGPGEGYEWPASEHGIFVDHKAYVWLGGEGGKTSQVLKFTRTGKFVMQIGRAGQSKGSLDTKNFNGAADVYIHPKTNELFVGDSNGHGRVMVLDADTGAFKRMWGGFGTPPTDPSPGERPAQLPNDAGGGWDVTSGDGPPFLSQAHCIRVSNDGFVYVCDGPFKRIQVFTLDGKYVTQVFINRGARPKSTNAAMSSLGRPFNEVEDELYGHHETSSRAALSGDPQQRFLFVNDRSTSKVLILDRKTLQILGSFGDGPGRAPGQFYVLHDVRADSKGNVYTAEVNGDGNRRAQKFIFKGMVPVSTQ